MAAYATQADLQTYLGAGVALPADAALLLDRATDLMRRASLGRSEQTTLAASQLADRNKATCAQVEFWLEAGPEVDILAPKGREQIGGFSREAPARLAPRAKDYLLMAGLLYRGVSM